MKMRNMDKYRVRIKLIIICIVLIMAFLYLINDRYYYVSGSRGLIRIDNWTGIVDRYNPSIGHWQTY